MRQPFFTKDGKEPLKSLPQTQVRDHLQAILKHLRSGDELVNQILAVTTIVSDDTQQERVGYQEVTTALEFIKCYPLITSRDKNTSEHGVGQVIKHKVPNQRKPEVKVEDEGIEEDKYV